MAANVDAMNKWKDEVKHLCAAGMMEEGLALAAPSDGYARCEVRETTSKLGRTTSLDMTC